MLTRYVDAWIKSQDLDGNGSILRRRKIICVDSLTKNNRRADFDFDFRFATDGMHTYLVLGHGRAGKQTGSGSTNSARTNFHGTFGSKSSDEFGNEMMDATAHFRKCGVRFVMSGLGRATKNGSLPSPQSLDRRTKRTTMTRGPQVIKRALLGDLCWTNRSILRQKVALMESIASFYAGNSSSSSQQQEAMTMELLYRRKCPVVGASIGQHFRHSLDHIERAVAAAAAAIIIIGPGSINNGGPEVTIHYDIRSRDTPDETDWYAAKTRIAAIDDKLHRLTLDGDEKCANGLVDACFYLNGGPDAEEVALPSTMARELGFAAHHAIHHMAMVRIIVQQQPKLPANVIPNDFGRAPSTIRYDGNPASLSQ
jgi:hypothetical protein